MASRIDILSSFAFLSTAGAKGSKECSRVDDVDIDKTPYIYTIISFGWEQHIMQWLQVGMGPGINWIRDGVLVRPQWNGCECK